MKIFWICWCIVVVFGIVHDFYLEQKRISMLSNGANYVDQFNKAWEEKEQKQKEEKQKITNNIKILKHEPCIVYDGYSYYKNLCGVVENNNSEDMDVTLEYNLYDKDEIKIKHSYIHLTIDGKGKAKFDEFLFRKNFDDYNIKIHSVRKD